MQHILVTLVDCNFWVKGKVYEPGVKGEKKERGLFFFFFFFKERGF